jgi:hypothetical protein
MKSCSMKSAVALLSLFVCTSAAHAAPGGLLLIGDSWADQQFGDQSHSMVFATLGFGQVQVFGAATVESGSTAAEWAAPDRLAIIGQALTDPAIEIVQLSVGGNDFLDAWNADLDPAAQAALFAAIRADVETIVESILATRPDVEVLLSFYDYPNFVDTLGGIIGALFCAPLWNSMEQPTPLELNTAASALEQSLLDLAAHPRVFHVSHFGQMQSLFGFPGMGIDPGDLQPPGDPALPSPSAALRSDGADCFHLSAEGYDQLVINQFEGYFETRFDVIFRSAFQ